MGLETVSFSDDTSFGIRALASVGPRAQGSQMLGVLLRPTLGPTSATEGLVPNGRKCLACY